MVRRVESPSSINTYKQCPRKYYYQYIEKIPTGTSIHLIRGNICHSALEDFFDIDFEKLGVVEDYKKFLHSFIGALLLKHWQLKHKELDSLGLSESELKEIKRYMPIAGISNIKIVDDSTDRVAIELPLMEEIETEIISLKILEVTLKYEQEINYPYV